MRKSYFKRCGNFHSQVILLGVILNLIFVVQEKLIYQQIGN